MTETVAAAVAAADAVVNDVAIVEYLVNAV